MATQSATKTAAQIRNAKYIERLAVALRTTDEKRIMSRVVALGEHDTCTRCGGSGNYSYCQMHGTTCFECSGSGKKTPKLTAELCERIEVKVAAGKLDEYLEQLRVVQVAKNADDRFFAAWRAQPEVAADEAAGKHWSEQTELTGAINTICAGISDAMRNDQRNLRFGYRHVNRIKTILTIEEKALISRRLEMMIEMARRSQAEIEKTGLQVTEAAKLIKAKFIQELNDLK